MKTISSNKVEKLQQYPQHQCIGCRRPIDLTTTVTFMCTKCKNYFCAECANYFNELAEKVPDSCPGSKEVSIGKHTAIIAKITRTIKESNPMGVSITELERSAKSRIIEKPTMKIIEQNTAPNVSSIKIIDDTTTVSSTSESNSISRPIKKITKKQPIIIDDPVKTEKE